MKNLVGERRTAIFDEMGVMFSFCENKRRGLVNIDNEKIMEKIIANHRI